MGGGDFICVSIAKNITLVPYIDHIMLFGPDDQETVTILIYFKDIYVPEDEK